MKFLGALFKILGTIVAIICGIGGLIIEFIIVDSIAGFWGIVIGFTILPATFTITPWYAFFKWGNWLPLAIIYGGGILVAMLFGIGYLISK